MAAVCLSVGLSSGASGCVKVERGQMHAKQWHEFACLLGFGPFDHVMSHFSFLKATKGRYQEGPSLSRMQPSSVV